MHVQGGQAAAVLAWLHGCVGRVGSDTVTRDAFDDEDAEVHLVESFTRVCRPCGPYALQGHL